MPSYFRQVPDFEYVSRLPDAKIGDYAPLKNLFKKGKLREDIFQNLAFFTKYQIKGNDRPDNVAFEIYGDSNLDWVVLLCNNIINVQTEWPLPQQQFDNYVLEKYRTIDISNMYFLNESGKAIFNQELIAELERTRPFNDDSVYTILYSGVHHYETKEVKNSQDVIIVPAGLQVSSPYSVSFYDYFADKQVDSGNIAVPVTNYEYEEKIENDKRNIFLLKSRYLNVVLDDIEDIMTYRKGSSQFKTETLKTADNIRLYS